MFKGSSFLNTGGDRVSCPFTCTGLTAEVFWKGDYDFF